MTTIALATTLLEGQTGLYTVDIEDENGNAVDISQLTTFTLTYYDKETREIINSRDGQDVFQTNDVTIATAIGPPLVTTLTWSIQPNDAIIIDDRRAQEHHVALFEWTWGGGARHAAHSIDFIVENLLFVP